MEHFKIETRCMKGASKCMRISGFMHGVNNPELTKCLNERVPKTMKEMMTATTAFKRGDHAAASKKKRVTRRKVTPSFAHVKEITFPPLTANKGTEGPLVIEAEIGGHAIHRIYIDGGSSMEVLYEHRFNRLWLEIKNQMVPVTTSLTGFSGESIWPLGQLRLLVTIGDAEHCIKAWMHFMIVRSPSPYNGIIRMPGIREIQAVPSTAHGMLKFLVNGEIITIRSTILTATECTTIATTPKETAKRLKHVTEILKAAKGMFLGYMINPEGIKLCPDKTEAVLQLPSPRTIKEVQSLNGKLASLNRFISKSTEKYLPLFKTLKRCIKKSDFHWTPDAEHAFKQLKQHLAELPMLVASKPKEELIMYLTAFYRVISAVLMTKKDIVQTPVYFVSRALQAPKLKYTPMEKLVLALVCAAKTLRRYFQAHPIVVITNQPIKQILEDFLVEKLDDAPPEASVIETPQEPWILFTDGSLGINGLGARLVLTSPKGSEFTYALRFQFTASNNEAEYEALIDGLWIAAQMGVCNVYVLVEILKEKSIQKKELVTVVEEKGPTWMTPIIEYLRDETLSENQKEASKLHIKARKYKLLEGILYRRSFLKPWLSLWTLREGNRSLGERIKARLEIGMPTYRSTVVDAVHNDEELRLNLDLLEERRERAAIREAKAKSKMRKYYNARVRGKLGPKWEGPYEVTEALGDGAYKLRSTDGTFLPRT
nr:reverse transcriptase domain-containing protein [Tanacetum cinerariifolium]